MDGYVTIVVICIAIGLGAFIGWLILALSEHYWKRKYEEIAKDVDKKVTEVIYSMDVEMFKIEKELLERKYKNKHLK